MGYDPGGFRPGSVKRRLVQHWVTLHQHLGRDPWQADCWTLDEALVIETYALDVALKARVSHAQR